MSRAVKWVLHFYAILAMTKICEYTFDIWVYRQTIFVSSDRLKILGT